MNEEEDFGIDLSVALAVQLDGSNARPHHFPGPRVRDQRVRHCQNEAWSGLAKNRELRRGENPGEPSSNGQAVAYDQLYKGRDFVDLF